MRDSVVADSTFYSCCACDIERKDILFEFLSAYSFFLGDKILEELPKPLTNNNDFSQLIIRKRERKKNVIQIHLPALFLENYTI